MGRYAAPRRRDTPITERRDCHDKGPRLAGRRQAARCTCRPTRARIPDGLVRVGADDGADRRDSPPVGGAALAPRPSFQQRDQARRLDGAWRRKRVGAEHGAERRRRRHGEPRGARLGAVSDRLARARDAARRARRGQRVGRHALDRHAARRRRRADGGARRGPSALSDGRIRRRWPRARSRGREQRGGWREDSPAAARAACGAPPLPDARGRRRGYSVRASQHGGEAAARECAGGRIRVPAAGGGEGGARRPPPLARACARPRHCRVAHPGTPRWRRDGAEIGRR